MLDVAAFVRSRRSAVRNLCCIRIRAVSIFALVFSEDQILKFSSLPGDPDNFRISVSRRFIVKLIPLRNIDDPGIFTAMFAGETVSVTLVNMSVQKV